MKGPENSEHHTLSEVLMDNLTDLIARIDNRGTILFANRTMLNVLGYAGEELIGKDLSVLLQRDDLMNIRRHISDILEGRTPYSMVVTAMTKGSDHLSLNTLLVPVIEDDKVTGLWLRAQDITGTKRLETDLMDSRAHIENIITLAEEGFVTLDREGKVLSWSRGAENITGIPAKAIIGRYFYTVLPNKVQRRRFIDRMREAVAGRPVRDMDCEHHRDDETVTYLSISATPVTDRDGETKELILILMDVTEKKHLEERLKESEKRLATEVIKRIEDLKYIEQLNRLVVQYMEEGAILLDANLKIGFVNQKMVDLMGYDEGDLIGRSIETLVPEDIAWVWAQIPVRAEKGSYRFEGSLVRRDGEEIPVMVTSSSIRIETKKSEFLCTVIDLTHQKRKEEEIREEMMEYKVKRGSTFLLMERGYTKVADVLSTLRRFGHNVVLVTRRSMRGDIEPLMKGHETAVYWLEERGKGSRSVPPEKVALMDFFEAKVNRTTVLVLDRLDYLMTKMGLEGFFDLLHSLVELFYQRKAILLLVGDPTTVSDQMLRQIEKDASVLEPKRAVILPDELQELLTYIFKQNKMGVEPSYKDVGTRFDITKTTTRKRIQQLLILDLLMETKKGRTKTLKITDRGRRFMPMEASVLN